MNTPRRFVSPLDGEQAVSLKYITANGSSARVRMRAQSILLSSKGYSIDEIANIADVYRNTVSSWIENWKEHGFESLHDKSRSGAPSKLTESEIETVKKIISEHPHSPKMIMANILKQVNKTVSISTLKRIIKKANLRWKRVRKSVKNKRNEKEFQKAEKEIENLKQQQAFGLIDLFCFDESGFSLNSQIPYAYQPVGETVQINSSHSKRLNILGFLDTANQFECFSFECDIDSEIAVRCFNEFSKIITKKTVVIIDNSPLHLSEEFGENIDKWEKKGLFIYYLPKYSPELNLIEILWRFIKYHWLPFSTYLSFKNLVKEVEDVLKNVGTKYKINFT